MSQDWNIHFDDKIYNAQMKKLFFMHLLYFWLSLTKAGQALFDDYKRLSIHLLYQQFKT